jgi:hypothetical protein
MALQINYYYEPFGTTFLNAYWRINPSNGIIGGKNLIKYTIEVFKNSEMAHDGKTKTIKGYSFSFVPDLSTNAVNFIAQAYNHAKALPMFHGSLDV